MYILHDTKIYLYCIFILYLLYIFYANFSKKKKALLSDNHGAQNHNLLEINRNLYQ